MLFNTKERNISINCIPEITWINHDFYGPTLYLSMRPLLILSPIIFSAILSWGQTLTINQCEWLWQKHHREQSVPTHTLSSTELAEVMSIYAGAHPNIENQATLISLLKENPSSQLIFALSQQEQPQLTEWINWIKNTPILDSETIGWMGKCIRNEEDARAYQVFKSQEGYALGIYYALRNGHFQPYWPLELIDILNKQLKLGLSTTDVCRAIKTIPTSQYPSPEIEQLLSQYSTEHWLDRMAIQMIGKCKTPIAAQMLTDIALNPTSNVHSITECLIQLKKYGASEKLVPLLNHSQSEIVCTTLECLAQHKIENSAIRMYIEQSQNPLSPLPSSIFWAQEAYQLALNPQEENTQIWIKFQEEKNPYGRMYAYGTIQNCPDLFDELLAFVLQAHAPTDLYYGTQCLLQMKNPLTTDWIQNLWAKNDEGIDALLLEHMRNMPPSEDAIQTFKKMIHERLGTYTLPKKIETRNEALNTLAHWGDTLDLPRSLPSSQIWTAQELFELPDTCHYQMIVNNGSITDTLIFLVHKNLTPLTALHFQQLVAQGFYNHKYFHRRVPNFVLQGGCPRGDGMGSLDYTIASEFSGEHFDIGHIGWASAGPHTESCQIFFMLDDAFHLDGRYTNMGKVIQGIETLDRLGLGTEIISIQQVP